MGHGQRENERKEFYIVLLNIHQRIPAISHLTSYDFSRFLFYYYCYGCSISFACVCLICITFLVEALLLADIFNEFRLDYPFFFSQHSIFVDRREGEERERKKMSDGLEFQFIYAPQTTHIINTSFEKQQPASKLVNRYLSTAAQYLNRTKSFHVSSTPSNNQKTDTRPDLTSANVLTDYLVQSSSTTAITSANLSMERNSSPFNASNNKSQGFVNTLRRSLRKNKERFYNKRAATMKSCHALNTSEQTVDTPQETPAKVSMTPTLFGRRRQEHRTNHHHPTETFSSVRCSNQTNDHRMRKRMNFFLRLDTSVSL